MAHYVGDRQFNFLAAAACPQVINPNKFLPYSVAAITLVAHSCSTWGRLIAKFNR
jgi:hypothetical protein